MNAIDEYISALERELHGPRLAKADMIAEARDSLVDAAEAYQGRGLPPAEAERRAVRSFGEIAEIAPGYQRELGLHQGHRTALLLFVVIAVQIGVANVTWRLDPATPVIVNDAYRAISTLVDSVGVAALAGALLAMLACRRGSRYIAAGPWLTTGIGAFAYVVSGLLAAGGAWLTWLAPTSGAQLAVVALLGIVSLMWIVRSAGRSLTTARA